MGKAKRKRARKNAARKKHQPVRMERHVSFKPKELAVMCRSWAYGRLK